MSKYQLPGEITHTFDPENPFLSNICDLPRTQAEAVLDRIRATGTRAIKANYLARRHRTENWLIEERRRLLGDTRRERPIYCFLGNFDDGLDLSRPRALVMPLSAFPEETLTFTYPDSMASLLYATREHHAAGRRPYHGRVFTLAEILLIVEEFRMPGPTERFIEVQVWDERPILEFLKSQG
jgi:hypothetical protein